MSLTFSYYAAVAKKTALGSQAKTKLCSLLHTHLLVKRTFLHPEPIVWLESHLPCKWPGFNSLPGYKWVALIVLMLQIWSLVSQVISPAEMIRLGVQHIPRSFRDIQGPSLTQAQNADYKAPSKRYMACDLQAADCWVFVDKGKLWRFLGSPYRIRTHDLHCSRPEYYN